MKKPFLAIALIAALNLGLAFGLRAQGNRPSDPLTPQQAYEQLLSVRYFAFGGVGFAGVTSEGEKAYRAIAGGTNALAQFSAVLTNGNAPAKLYALCGIRQLSPRTFDTHAKSLRMANPEVETMSGCIVRHEFATNVVARIASGSYELQSRNRNGESPAALFRQTPGNNSWLLQSTGLTNLTMSLLTCY